MAERDTGNRDGKAALPAALDAIPDLFVAPSAHAKPAGPASAPMSVKDMEDFGMEAQALQLDLDLGDRKPSPPPALPKSRDGTSDEPSEVAPVAAPAGPPAPAAADRWRAMVRFLRSIWAEDAPLGLQLTPGIALVALALLLTLSSQLYAAVAGEVISIGPLGTGWLAGFLLLGGLGLVAYRLVKRQR